MTQAEPVSEYGAAIPTGTVANQPTKGVKHKTAIHSLADCEYLHGVADTGNRRRPRKEVLAQHES